jgi:hypothetical protein
MDGRQDTLTFYHHLFSGIALCDLIQVRAAYSHMESNNGANVTTLISKSTLPGKSKVGASLACVGSQHSQVSHVSHAGLPLWLHGAISFR